MWTIELSSKSFRLKPNDYHFMFDYCSVNRKHSKVTSDVNPNRISNFKVFAIKIELCWYVRGTTRVELFMGSYSGTPCIFGLITLLPLVVHPVHLGMMKSHPRPSTVLQEWPHGVAASVFPLALSSPTTALVSTSALLSSSELF